MSASREKKIRQELAAQGIPDIKEIRAAEERKQQRRANWLYGTIAVVFVVVGAALLLWNSNVIQRGSTAISVDGEKYSAAEVNYYFNSAYNSVTNGTYAAYLSLNTSLPLQQQTLEENDYLFLGITQEDGVDKTWHEYFTDSAKTALIQLTALKKAAEEAGFTFTDEMQAEVDATMDLVALYAQQAGMSTANYVKAAFGSTMTLSVFEEIVKDNTIASFYEQSYIDSLEYSDAEIEAYYAENEATFDTVAYDYIYFKGTASSTTDAEGNVVAATDEEHAAAKEAAKNAAGDALERYQDGQTDMEALAKDYEMASFSSLTDAANYYDTISLWLFDDARQDGDVAVLESGESFYLVRFNHRGRYEYNTVNARHILVSVDTSALDSEADDYEAKLEELKKEAGAEAERILNEWKSGAATAESFGELANKESDDGGSNTTGGLYTQIYKGQMVDPFEEWCFDASRQVGDTGIVFVEATNYTGYHVMYFEGVDKPYWEVQVTNTLANTDHSDWSAALVEGLEATEHSGMKYVG